MQSAAPRDLALAMVRKHLAVHRTFDHYTGIVTLHGMARLAEADPTLHAEARELFLPYARGERTFKCNFPNYQCGGLGAAYLLWRRLLPEVEEAAATYARQIMKVAPRDSDGILSMPGDPNSNKIWIDVAFAVTPFMLFTGLALQQEEWVEEGFQQIAKMAAVLRNPENGLYHQSRNFTGRLPGNISEDHWSRGNGWGIYALAELASYLPEDHPRRAESLRLYRDLLEACASVQDGAGLWRQEMTEPDAYVETSGSALILYAIGAGLSAGVLEDDPWRARFEKGLRGLLIYISRDFDVYHTCRGCLSPNHGTKLDYMARAPIPNDPHAFGPVALAMGQAHRLGIATVTHPNQEPTS